MDLIELKRIASQCTNCELHKSRKVPIFYKGNPNADILICGMCPGPDENKIENKELQPFVGRAGKLLDKMLLDVCLDLSNVYITNLIKCFVKPGIKLKHSWIDNCIYYFLCEIQEVKPKVIIGLGGDVSCFLSGFKEGTPMKKLRTTDHKYLTIPLICTYHPSYFTRGGYENHKDYNKGLDDFNKAIKIIL